jgi:dihydrodipicolinate synthase/N-acetylneuraminate lyase
MSYITSTSTRPVCCAQVVGNTGSNSTGEALHATEQGFAVGMHAALQINPYYGKTSKAGLKAHFDAVLREGPAIIYNVPGRTGQDIPDDIVQGMASHPNFLGMKECTGNERIGKYTKQVCWGHAAMLSSCPRLAQHTSALLPTLPLPARFLPSTRACPSICGP